MERQIKKLKEEKNAVILAHYYAPDEVQRTADYIGDSFYLAKVAKNSNADIILFCGVSFMGESAKILNPDKKVLMREAGRLEASLSAAEKTGLPILVFLHYPPVYKDYECREILDILKQHNVKTVYHGHIHGLGYLNAVTEYEGIEFKLISCDCIDFTPYFIA